MSEETSTVPPVTWEVISQQPAQGRLATGQYGPGHLITARLASGSTFQVFVPNEDYSSIDRVRGLLAAKAAAVQAVDRLTSSHG